MQSPGQILREAKTEKDVRRAITYAIAIGALSIVGLIILFAAAWALLFGT